MLKYKLKENSIKMNTSTPMADYLRSLGIQKTESFMGIPPKEDELNPFLLDNMDRCVDMLHELFTTNQRLLLIVDCDVDGFTSSSIFYRYFKNYYRNANISYFMHEEKEHGIEKNKMPDLDTFDAVIIPDAGSMQLEEQQWLLDNGKRIVIMDHHEVTESIEHPNLVIVNNQSSPLFPNKALSGAGVVLKTIQAYDKKYPDLFVGPDGFYDLAALGILADCMDIRALDNNYIIWKGLMVIRNKMFKALLEKQAYSVTSTTNPTKIDVVFYVAPLINSVIRAGTQEEKLMLFRGFIEEPLSNEPIVTEYAGEKRVETPYQFAARTAYNVRSRQNSTKDKCFEFLRTKIERLGLDKHKVIAVVASKEDQMVIPQTLTGLIAMELLKYYNKPVLVLRPKMDNGRLVYAGSGRAKEADGFSSFLQFVRESENTSYGEGHAFAFGAAIPADQYDAFLEECDTKLADVEFGSSTTEVDAIIYDNQINAAYRLLYEFAEYGHVFGNAIPQPKIAVEARVSASQMMVMGKDKSSVRVTVGNIPCIKFKDKELAAQVAKGGSFKVSLIGRPQMNEWLGNKSPQIMIEQIEVSPVTTASLF